MAFYGKKFAEFRKQKFLSIKYLIAQLNISQRTLWSWENEEREPNENYIRRMAKIIDIPVTQISDLQPVMEESPVTEKTVVPPPPAEGKTSPYPDAFDGLLKQIQDYRNRTEQNSLIINAMLHSMDAIFYVKNTQNNYMAASASFLRNLGIPVDTPVKNKTDYFFFTNLEAEKNSTEDESIIASKEPIINREDYIPGSKRQKWGLTSKIPIFDSNKNIIGIIGTFIDITARKNAERIREISEIITNAMSLVVIIKEVKTNKILYLSDTVEKVYGRNKELFFEDTELHLNIMHPDDRKKALEYRQQNTYPEKNVFRVIMPDNSEKYMGAVVSKINYNNKDCNLFVEYDITDFASPGASDPIIESYLKGIARK